MTPAATVPASRRQRSLLWWLGPTGVFAVIAIGVLWAIPRPAPVCIAIYPPPPECATGGDPTTVVVFLVLIVALYAALVTCALLLPAGRQALVLGLLSGALGLVFLIGLAAALAAAAGPTYLY